MNKIEYFRSKIKEFYKLNKRDFYWRTYSMTPFQVLVTELFLKKTRAETVNKFIPGFIKKYPTNRNLLEVSEEELSRNISVLGLGKQRARGLKAISAFIHEQLEDKLTANLEKLMDIPHVGMYIANATLCFGFNKRFPVIDVNVSRVISRFFSIDNRRDLRDNKDMQEKATELLSRRGFKEYNWGLLDLGALVCKTRPVCNCCPLRKKCDYYTRTTIRG